MKIRIRFSKTGEMKYIGHLDIMRFFQKAMRRAGIDIAFSEGMSPHMIMSFASPLGVGVTSEGEYLDIEVRTPQTSGEMMERLNAVMAEGIRILGCVSIASGRASNAMSLVAAADYLVSFDPADAFDEEAFARFLQQREIMVIKKGKKGERSLDIRPLILNWQMRGELLWLRLCAGSENNLKCELVLEAFRQFLKRESGAEQNLKAHFHRLDLYAASGEEGGLISLGDLGREITDEDVYAFMHAGDDSHES